MAEGEREMVTRDFTYPRRLMRPTWLEPLIWRFVDLRWKDGRTGDEVLDNFHFREIFMVIDSDRQEVIRRLGNGSSPPSADAVLLEVLSGKKNVGRKAAHRILESGFTDRLSSCRDWKTAFRILESGLGISRHLAFQIGVELSWFRSFPFDASGEAVLSPWAQRCVSLCFEFENRLSDGHLVRIVHRSHALRMAELDFSAPELAGRPLSTFDIVQCLEQTGRYLAAMLPNWKGANPKLRPARRATRRKSLHLPPHWTDGSIRTVRLDQARTG